MTARGDRMDERHSKPRILLIVQTDSITGEAAGAAITDLYEAGALNVQVCATITKKNRPGHLFFIDCSDDCVASVENTVLRELGVTGWHRVHTEHCYISVRVVEKCAVVHVRDRQFRYVLLRKESSAEPEVIRPEHDNCVQLKKKLLEECGASASLRLVRDKIIAGFLQKEDPAVLEFK